jgi:ribosome maturation factor RimP
MVGARGLLSTLLFGSESISGGQGVRREELGELVEPILREEGFELVECSISRTPKSQVFRFFVDREEGVTVEGCSLLSRRIALLLDANPVLRGAYLMEVSSAGMDRPVWKPDHFRRFAGEVVRFEVEGSDGRAKPVQGRIGPLEGEGVRIRLDSGEERVFRFAEMGRAHLHMDPWKARPRTAAEDKGRGA